MINKHKAIVLFALSFSIWACVPKSDYKKLESELKQTKDDLYVLEQQYNEVYSKYTFLAESERKRIEEKNKIPHVSKETALTYVKDWYSFYGGVLYRNLKIRRVSDNKFNVSVEESDKNSHLTGDYRMWFHTIRTLTINNNDTYSYIKQ